MGTYRSALQPPEQTSASTKKMGTYRSALRPPEQTSASTGSTSVVCVCVCARACACMCVCVCVCVCALYPWLYPSLSPLVTLMLKVSARGTVRFRDTTGKEKEGSEFSLGNGLAASLVY